MSQRSSLLGGNQGFQKIPDMQRFRSQSGGNGASQDATVDIPLTKVLSGSSGARKAETNEKASEYIFRTGGRRRPRQDLKGSDIEGVNSMGKIYHRFLRSSIVVRYFFYIIPVGAILTVPIVVGALVTNPGPPGIGNVRIVWIFAWALTMWVALWASKLFAKTLPYVFTFLCGIVSPGTRKYSTIIRALEIPISLFLWALASLATFRPILTNNPNPFTFSPTAADAQDQLNYANNWIDICERVLASFFASAGIYLIEKLIVQLISISYHHMQYDANIRESKSHVHVLSMLYDASIAQFPAFCPEFLEEDYLINDTPELIGTRRGPSASGTATPMKILANVNRVGGRITAAFGNIAQEVTGKEVFNPTSAHSIVVEALEKNHSSEALAKRIWMSLVAEGKVALYQSDLIEVLIDQPTNVAVDAFDLLDADKNGDITLDEMILKVCEVGRSRKAIANSLHDVDQAINVLDNLLLAAVLTICVFIFIAFLNTSFVTTLATAGTALLSLSFVFAGTAQEVLGSCIFLFAKHPFDVGDVVVINSQKLIVERISLLFTVFKVAASHTTTQCPNAQLSVLWIDNVTRSKSMRETLTIDVSFDTTLEDVELFRREMEMFVRDNDNARDFESDIEVTLISVGSMDKLQLGIDIKHKSNWSNGAVTASRRSKFMCAVVLAVRKVPIYGPGGGTAALGSADQPSYTVSVNDEQAARARAAFDRAKAEQHTRAQKPSSTFKDVGISSGVEDSNTLTRQRTAPIGPTSETRALANLSTRAPTQDANHEWQTADRAGSVRRRPVPPFASPEQARLSDVDSSYSLTRSSTHGKRRQSAASRDSANSNLRPPRIDEPMPAGGPSMPARSPTFSNIPRGESLPATYYNPYVQTAPVYDYPPGQTLTEEEEEHTTRAPTQTAAPPSIPIMPLPALPRTANQSATSLHELDAGKKSGGG